MRGQDFQDKLDALVADMTGKPGIQTTIFFRFPGNSPNGYSLATDANGVVDAAQLAAIQAVVNDMKPIADAFDTESVPVKTASEAFKTAQAPHEPLIEAARVARVALNDALTADVDYQTAKTALDNARADVDYVAAADAYRNNNISENFGNLGDAKGKYSDI